VARKSTDPKVDPVLQTALRGELNEALESQLALRGTGATLRGKRGRESFDEFMSFPPSSSTPANPKKRLPTPFASTLWAFLSQVLFKGEQRSCIAAVARVIVLLAELDIRAIKITMGMDALRCKTPEMVRKEMWTCLLAYNLIRQTMLQSARESGLRPRELSFTAALQSIAASWLVIVLSDDSVAATLIEASLASLTLHTIGHRPNRVEPRAVKRRPKPHDLLTTPRAEARNELLTGERKKSS